MRPARRALRPLPRRGPRAPAGPRQRRRPPRRLELHGRPPRLRAAARERRALRDPHLPAPRLRPRDPLPAPRGGLGERLRDAPPRRRARPLAPARSRRATRRSARDRTPPPAPPDRLDRRARAPFQARALESGGLSAASAFAGTFALLNKLVIRCKSPSAASMREAYSLAAGSCSSGGGFRPRLPSGLERVRDREGRPRSFPVRPAATRY